VPFTGNDTTGFSQIFAGCLNGHSIASKLLDDFFSARLWTCSGGEQEVKEALAQHLRSRPPESAFSIVIPGLYFQILAPQHVGDRAFVEQHLVAAFTRCGSLLRLFQRFQHGVDRQTELANFILLGILAAQRQPFGQATAFTDALDFPAEVGDRIDDGSAHEEGNGGKRTHCGQQ